MPQEWFYTRDGKTRLGPVSADELRSLAKSCLLLPTDMVLKQGSNKWTPAGTVKGLFPALASTPGRSGRTGPAQPRQDTDCAERTPTIIEVAEVVSSPPAPSPRPRPAPPQPTHREPPVKRESMQRPASGGGKSWLIGVVLAAAGIAAAVVAIWIFWPDPEPEDPVPRLIANLDDPNPHWRKDAADRLGALGSKAARTIPKLKEQLQYQDPGLREAASRALVNIASACLEGDQSERVQGIAVLAELGGSARDAIPLLIPLLADPQVGELTKNALESIRPNPRDYGLLVNHLKNSKDGKTVEIRIYVARTIGNIKGEPSSAVIDALIGSEEKKFGLDGDPQVEVRCEAAVALSNIGKRNEGYRTKVVPALLNAVAEPDPVGAQAQQSLTSLKLDGTRDFDDIKVACKHKSEKVRLLAFAVLANDEVNEKVAKVFAEGLRDKEPRICKQALESLGKSVGADAKNVALLALVKFMASSDTDYADLAIKSLDKLGIPPYDHVEAVVKLLDRPYSNVKSYALKTLGQFGPRAKTDQIGGKLRQIALEKKTETEPTVRQQAVLALGNIFEKSEDKLVVNALLDGARDPDLADDSLKSLTQVWTFEKIDIGELEKLLDIERAPLQIAVMKVLGQIGERAKPVAPKLQKLAAEDNRDVKAAAISALGKIGREKASFDAVVKALPGREAFKAFKDLVSPAKDIDVLAKLACDEKMTAEIQLFAIEQIGELGPKARSHPKAVEAVQQAAMKPELREQAVSTLGKIGRAEGSVKILTDLTLLYPKSGAFKALKGMQAGQDTSPFVSSDTLALEKLLTQSKQPEHRSFALDALAGVKGKDAVMALQEALKAKDETFEFRTQIISALGKIERDASPAVPVILSTLKDELTLVQEGGIEGLKRRGTWLAAWEEAVEANKRAVKAFAAANMRFFSIQAKQKAVQAYETAAADLRNAVENAIRGDEELTRPFVATLAKIGKQAVPYLSNYKNNKGDKGALYSDSPVVRWVAARALGAIGPGEEREALRARAQSKTEFWRIREAAKQALGK